MNSPTKRKICQVVAVKESEDVRKKLRFGQGQGTGQENHVEARQILQPETSNCDQAGITSTQETMADHPESQDTITDTEIPSSGSDRTYEIPSLPQTAKKDSTAVVQTNESIASSIKRRLQLAMYKLKSHKEDIDYRKLVPRQLISGRVENVAQPTSRPIAQPSPRALASHLSTPKPVNSIVSNERTLPRLMQRSSSGDASITETPIRRNYQVGLHSPPESHAGLPRYGSVKLPSILGTHDIGQSQEVYSLPSISALGAISQSK